MGEKWSSIHCKDSSQQFFHSDEFFLILLKEI